MYVPANQVMACFGAKEIRTDLRFQYDAHIALVTQVTRTRTHTYTDAQTHRRADAHANIP